MTGNNTETFDDAQRDDPMIAAEYALGLLEGEELRKARGAVASDPQFAWRKQWWDNWFAPWTDEMPGLEPDPQVWSRIEAQVHARHSVTGPAAATGAGAANAAADGKVVALHTRLRRWQWAAGISAAAAAVLLAVLVFAPGNDPAPSPGVATQMPQIAAADPLVASIPIGETQLRLGITYLPGSGDLLVSASGLTADGVHDHELWLVPEDGGDLQSLGVVVPGEERRVTMPAEITANVADGARLVVTREPLGGKPEGAEAGPVVAQGTLSQV